jgi:hypothetical protein
LNFDLLRSVAVSLIVGFQLTGFFGWRRRNGKKHDRGLQPLSEGGFWSHIEMVFKGFGLCLAFSPGDYLKVRGLRRFLTAVAWLSIFLYVAPLSC